MPTLLVLCGPTGVGKTELALTLAQRLNTVILNADSRQLYRDLPIGTAAPTPEQLARVKHYFVGTLALTDYYSAARYEEDALAFLQQLFLQHDTVILSGGSMLYIDAVCRGIDEMPTITPTTRENVRQQLTREGLPALVEQLKRLDPTYCNGLDLCNTKRVVHALEICLQTGQPYSSFRTQTLRKRPFNIVKFGLTRPREELFTRINARTLDMMNQGFEQEARRVLPFRNCNALNTVGYKELFNYFDGTWTLPFAVEKIQRNTRVYAKKQLTWLRKDDTTTWLHPDDPEAITKIIARLCTPPR